MSLPPSSKANFCRPKNSCDYRRDCHTIPTINEIFRTTTFITNYTKISYISFFTIICKIILQSQYYFNLTFISVIPPSAIFLSSPSFRNTSNSTISYQIYRNYLYLTLSLISRTALSARSNPPPKTSYNFQVFAISLPSCRENLKSSKIIIRLFLRQSAVTPDNITVYAPLDIKTGSS